jgi:hypothetical protein
LVQSLVAGQPLPHLEQRAVEQPRDVRLRETERLRNLGLRAVEEEPLEHDPALAAVERPRRAGDERAVEPDLLERRRRVPCVVLAEISRPGAAGKRARHANDRRVVAEVVEELTFYAPRHVRGKLQPAEWIAPVDRPDDCESRDLHQVVVTPPPAAGPARKLAGERQVPLDQLPAFGVEPPLLRRHAPIVSARAGFSKCICEILWITAVAHGYLSHDERWQDVTVTPTAFASLRWPPCSDWPPHRLRWATTASRPLPIRASSQRPRQRRLAPPQRQ